LAQVPGEDRRPVRGVVPERRERRRGTAAADPELETSPGQQVQYGGVLGDAQRRLERQRHDRRTENDPRCPRGRLRQEDERRRKPAFRLVEMVLCHPGGVEADTLRRADLLQRVPVPVGRRRLLEEPGEEPESLPCHSAQGSTL
jgi:hypothetical protein